MPRKDHRTVDRFPRNVVSLLGHYVYAYVDPRDNSVFYIGKGVGQRAFAHLDDFSKPTIAELQNLGLKPQIELLKWGLTDAEAIIVESTAIDLYGLDKLNNRVAGHHGMRADVRQVISELAAPPISITHPCILFTLSRQFRYDMTAGELYDATRAAWKLRVKRAEKAEFAMGVYRDVIQEVYVAEAWVRGHSTIQASGLREWTDQSLDDRHEFVGRLAPEKIRHRYVGHSIAHIPSSQNPVRYVNC